MTAQIYDVVVIGGGAVGLAATYEVAKAGKSVLVLEQNTFYNQAGSSGDMARMYRTMYTEDYMADLAYKSLDIWLELEKDAGTSLRSTTGLLNFGDPTMGDKTPEGTLLGPIDNLKRLGMSYKELTKDQIEEKWPFKNLPDKWVGLFAPDNGVINVPLLLRTLSRLAKDYGAHSRQNVEAVKLTAGNETGHRKCWTVEARQDGSKVEFKAHKIIITPGAYANHILEPSFNFKLKLTIWEMTASYFSMNAGPNGTVFPSMWFQFAENEDGRSQLFYGFPALEWGPSNMCRIAVDDATRKIDDPNERSTSVISPEDVANVQDFVKKHVAGVDSTVPAYSLTCLQTNTDDNMFVLDFIPEKYLNGGEKDSVMIFTAGWAMKFVPLLGRALRQMAIDGHSQYALDKFRITRDNVIVDPHAAKTASVTTFSAEDSVVSGGSSMHRFTPAA